MTADEAFARCDWETTPLGVPAGWPQSLKTAAGICRASRFPMVIFWGPEFTQIYNEDYIRILGRAKHPDAMGTSARTTWSEIWDTIGPMLTAVRERGEATWSENLLLRVEREGVAGEHYFTFSYSPIRDERGIGGVFCAVQETTDTVLRERQLTELNRAKSAFFNNITHEFRTPLSLMLGPLEIARERAVDDTARNAVEMATRNALRLVRLVDSLLAFARIEAGRLDPQFESTDLSTLTSSIVASFESVASRAGLLLHWRCDRPIVAIVDAHMWESIVLNLLSNALKFTRNGAIEVALERDADDVVLRVTDTGIGIPAADLARIFERFYRAPSSGGRTVEGAGIGLALTKDLVELHGGSIAAVSADGRTTLTVRIPRGDAERPIQASPNDDSSTASLAAHFLAEAHGWVPIAVESAASPPGAASILIVDDNADLRAHLQSILRARYHVRAAIDGVDALRLIEEERPNLVLSDVMMPRMDGNELLRKIRELPGGNDIAVVLLSARGDEREIASALDGDADDYIPKPFGTAELLARVATQLRLQQKRRDAERSTRVNEAAFKSLADLLPGMIWTTSQDGKRDFNNAAWRAFTGIAEGEDWSSKCHPDDLQMWYGAFDKAKAEGRPFRLDYRLWHAGSQRYRWVTVQAYQTTIGDTPQWVGTIIDIDERKRRELANGFLASAGSVLTQSLDLKETLARLATLAVASICDYCVFYLVRDDAIERVVWKHRDPGGQRILDRAIECAPSPGDPGWIVSRVIRTQQPFVWKRGDEMVAAETEDPAYAQFVQELDLNGVATCPVHLGDNVYGALSLARIGHADPFDAFDLETIRQLAARTAIAIANADLFAREHRVALSFQNAALPDHLPQRAGVALDAYYVAGRSDARVGGDWYDAEALADGRVLLSVGDVSGSGLDAAVVMSMVRNAMRSVAHVYADPATILEAAQRATEHRLGEHFVTAFVAIVDPVVGRLTYCNAGHMPPLVRDGDRVSQIRSDGLPIGLGLERDWRTEMIRMPGEMTLVFYTDGLTEGAGAFLPGEEALLQRVASPGFAAHPRARALYEELLPHGSRDDVAIMIARISSTAAERATVRMPFRIREPRDATFARDAICTTLMETFAFSSEALENARLIVGELTANIARHARGDAVAIVDRASSWPVLHLVDNGAGFRYSNRLPPNVFAESGRGLFIASALAARLEVLPDIDGGSHVIAVLATR